MKHISYIGLGALLLALLAGCGANSVNICYDNEYGICKLRTQRPPTPPLGPKISVLPVPKESSTCECPNAEGFNLINEGGTGSVNILTISRGPSDTVAHQESSSVTIQGGKSIPLFCSVQPTAATKKCELSVVTLVNGKPYGGDVNTIMRGIVKATATADMEHMTPLPTPNGDCPQKCKSPTHCTIFDESKSKSAGLGREIALLLGVPRTLIANDKIVGLTGSRTNECQRSDVIFEGEHAYNIGLLPGCQIQTKLPNSLGEVGITIPRTLAFKHTLSPGNNGNFRLKFDREQAALQLAFANSTLQTILGGSLLAVDYDAGSFVFEMQSHACLSVKLD